MTNKEVVELLNRNKVSSFALDANTKNQITKSSIDTAIREATRHLASKKRVWMILIKE